MSAISPEEARAYLRRFELVRQVERDELRRTSMDTKLRQLAALMASRHAFAADANRDRELQVVRERWAQLRKALNK